MTTPVSFENLPDSRWGRGRVVVGVTGVWLIIGIVMGAQAALGSALRGTAAANPLAAIRDALVPSLPWIPVTLAVIMLTIRFPFAHGHRNRDAAIHLSAATLLAYAANVLVVLGWWLISGKFKGLGPLLREGVLWTTLRLHIAFVIYAAIFGITQAVLYYRRTRSNELRLARLEGQLSRARLQALNAQMRPHFLFNTLHSIGQLWRSGQNDEADAALDHLGALFHKVYSSTTKFEVPLGEELSMVREYLAIESARFRDRLHARVEAADDAIELMVPPLILQPLVENAVRHGLSAKSSAGRIEVSAIITPGGLRLRVFDDGPGVAARTAQPGSGTGLRNTRERLAQLYGDRAHFSIESDPSSGTTVTVTIPLRHLQ